MVDPSIWRSKTNREPGMIPCQNASGSEPHDIGSNPVLDRQNLDRHGANQTFAYLISSQESTGKDWSVKQLHDACHAPFLPELSKYQRRYDELPGDGNDFHYFPII
jgi:hypothetical protein